jgi:hypothetical protein
MNAFNICITITIIVVMAEILIATGRLGGYLALFIFAILQVNMIRYKKKKQARSELEAFQTIPDEKMAFCSGNGKSVKKTTANESSRTVLTPIIS